MGTRRKGERTGYQLVTSWRSQRMRHLKSNSHLRPHTACMSSSCSPSAEVCLALFRSSGYTSHHLLSSSAVFSTCSHSTRSSHPVSPFVILSPALILSDTLSCMRCSSPPCLHGCHHHPRTYLSCPSSLPRSTGDSPTLVAYYNHALTSYPLRHKIQPKLTRQWVVHWSIGEVK